MKKIKNKSTSTVKKIKDPKHQFEYLDHTADLKIKATGKTIEEAFENTAKAGTNFLTNVDKIKPVMKRKIKVSSKRLQTLLYDFLEELLILIDIEGFLFSKAESIKISTEGFSKDKIYSLDCIALGDHYKNYEMKGDLKAVTYSDMSIEIKENIVEIIVVYDI